MTRSKRANDLYDQPTDQIWTGYSNEELHAIRVALPSAVSEETFSQFIEELVGLVRASPELRPQDFLQSARDVLKAIEDDVAQLNRAKKVLYFYFNEGNEPISSCARRTISAMDTFSRQLMLKKTASISILKDMNMSKKSWPSNRYNYFQSGFLNAVSRIWTKCGGNVSFSASYSIFFRSVVRPVFTYPSNIRQHGVSWTSGMFREHVSKVLRERRSPR